MTHSIYTADAGGELPYFQRLWRTLLDPNTDPRAKLEQLFTTETAEFGLNFAFLSHIDLENEREHFEIVHGSHKYLKQGAIVPLKETYCRKTIADPEGTLAVSDAIAEGWENDPAYETFELGSYLGTTVMVDDDLYGTLCFANTEPRDEPIRDKEISLIKMHGQWVEYTVSLWEGPPIWEAYVDTTEERAVSSGAIDLMMDTLRKRTRRVVLLALLGNTPEVTLDTLVERVNDERAVLWLVHNDLPKLANAGYITWDRNSETVSRGPKFPEVEPLVQLLQEYNASFPE